MIPQVTTARGAESRVKHDLREPSDADLLAQIYPLHSSSVGWHQVNLQLYHIILVTGPQRSGTTWVACTLATDLDFDLYDERHPITTGNDTLISLQHALAYLRTQKRGSVVQSPMATVVLDALPRFPGLLVLFLARNCLEVFRSQNRVIPQRGGWTCARPPGGREREMRKYRRRPELLPFFDSRDMICVVKQQVWMRYQRPLLVAHQNGPEYTSRGLNLTVTISFDSFKSHPRWLAATNRSHLEIKSTNCPKLFSTPARASEALPSDTQPNSTEPRESQPSATQLSATQVGAAQPSFRPLISVTVKSSSSPKDRTSDILMPRTTAGETKDNERSGKGFGNAGGTSVSELTSRSTTSSIPQLPATSSMLDQLDAA